MMNDQPPTKTTRWALGISYRGTEYFGFQRQKDVVTVQSCLEDALSHVADHGVKLTCAGRTDRGVHALGQVIHFDTRAVREHKSWVMGVNSALPRDIRVLWAKPVTDEFHARFGATHRRYRYVIHNHRVRSAIWHDLTTWEPRPLNMDAMHEAAQVFVGTHDFTSFRAVQCQAKSPVRTVYEAGFKQEGEHIVFECEANAFLHHQIRNFIGSLLMVGRGEHDGEWIKAVLESRDRKQAGATASAHGLYFLSVTYEKEIL
jgi:tRNA pseudouridine38-40 synthase